MATPAHATTWKSWAADLRKPMSSGTRMDRGKVKQLSVFGEGAESLVSDPKDALLGAAPTADLSAGTTGGSGFRGAIAISGKVGFALVLRHLRAETRGALQFPDLPVD